MSLSPDLELETMGVGAIITDSPFTNVMSSLTSTVRHFRRSNA